MRLINKKSLEKHKRKNLGNKDLSHQIETLIKDIEKNKWKTPHQLKMSRSDADKVHNDGFYFFNISAHRTMILIEFSDEEATVVWVGAHDEYEKTFRNNKATIQKWLKNKGWL